MPTTIALTINTCKECPHCYNQRHYTSDSWEHAYDYFCGLLPTNDGGHYRVGFYIEWPSEMPSVPDCCPIKIEEV